MTTSSINLEKGQKISLAKDDGGELTSIAMCLGWDAKTGGLLGYGGSSIDLDASCVLFDVNKTVVDTVSFRQLFSKDGSIRHSGDNLTGEGDGDDEIINIDLHRIPANVEQIVFTVNSYQGQTFDKVKNCFCRLVETVGNKEVCIYKLNEKGSTNTGLIMAKLYRHNGKWKMNALGIPCNGRTVSDLSREIQNIL